MLPSSLRGCLRGAHQNGATDTIASGKFAVVVGLRARQLQGVCRASAVGCSRYRNGPSRECRASAGDGSRYRSRPSRVCRASAVGCSRYRSRPSRVCRASTVGCSRYRNGPSRECVVRAPWVARAIAAGLQESVSCERRGLLALSQPAFKRVCRASAVGCSRYRSRPSRVCRASAGDGSRYRSRPSRECVVRVLWLLALSQPAFKRVCCASAVGCLRYRSRPSRECVVRAPWVARAIAAGLQESVSCERRGLLALSQPAFKRVCRASAVGCSRYRSGPSRECVGASAVGCLRYRNRPLRECVVRAPWVARAIVAGLQECVVQAPRMARAIVAGLRGRGATASVYRRTSG